MDRIRVSLSHAHAFADAEAEARLDRLFQIIAVKFKDYGTTYAFEEGSRRVARFSFNRPGKGEGGGRASLAAGRLDVEIDARYKLPFLVPVRLAEGMVKEEFRKAVEEAFRAGSP